MEQSREFLKCAFDTCANYGYVQGLCPGHAAQDRKGQELSALGERRWTGSDHECSVQDCGNIRWSGGMCRGHYLQQYHNRPLRPVKQVPWETCAADRCERSAVTGGFCNTHYTHSLHKTPKRVCTVSGCGRPHDARGYCKTHWAQWKKGQTPGEVRQWGVYNQEGEVRCALPNCAKVAISRDLCPNHVSTSNNFSLSTEQLVALFSDAKCAVCSETRRLCIDHDHACCPGDKSCGACVRGVLCTWCNSTLGHAKDSIERLKGLVEYLETRPTVA